MHYNRDQIYGKNCLSDLWYTKKFACQFTKYSVNRLNENKFKIN